MASREFVMFKKLLRKNSNFVTMPRMRLFATLQKHPALTLKELIAATPKHDQVTVYRNVDLFEKLGIINRLRLGWQTKIELSDIFLHHHHHLTCIKCSKIFDLPENTMIEEQINKIAKENSFKPTDHQLEIRGYCHSCSSNNSV